jgi:hypothetical protein
LAATEQAIKIEPTRQKMYINTGIVYWKTDQITGLLATLD